MKIGLKNVTFLSNTLEGAKSEVTNLVIENGVLQSLNAELPEVDLLIDEPGLHVSEGWVDLRVSSGEPGFEHRETLSQTAAAAAQGGFTHIALLPAKDPVTQTKASVEYLASLSGALPVSVLPLAAVTHNLEGNDLTEMHDLKEAGAFGFTDGSRPVYRADVLARALEYALPLNTVVMQRAELKELTQGGLMHEGTRSTMLGLKGVPAIAETLAIEQALQLAKYTGGKLHISLLSTAQGVQQVRLAKQAGLAVTCDVAAHQLAFTDETLIAFDTNYKVRPPFRTEADRQALIQGLTDGTIDAIVSDHQPLDEESKELEFDLAEFGILGLETAYAVANMALSNVMSQAQLIAKITSGPRKILKLKGQEVKQGTVASLTLFHPEKEWVFTEATKQSTCNNSPFLNTPLKGQVYGIIHKGKFTKNNAW